MILETRYASGKNTVRYKKNTGYSNHRELFDDLKDFQQQRDDNNDYSLQVVYSPRNSKTMKRIIFDFWGNEDKSIQ